MKFSKLLLIAVMLLILCGCESLRFAPGESQKQNAWLHYQAAQMAADQAVREQTSDELVGLTKLGRKQSEAFVSYFGIPEKVEYFDEPEQILNEANIDIADSAKNEAMSRPDVWEITDGLLELSIGLAGLAGGAYGVRAVRFLKNAQERSQALKEIITGNEVLKKLGPQFKEQFSKAQSNQSATTKRLVTELKAG